MRRRDAMDSAVAGMVGALMFGGSLALLVDPSYTGSVVLLLVAVAVAAGVSVYLRSTD